MTIHVSRGRGWQNRSRKARHGRWIRSDGPAGPKRSQWAAQWSLSAPSSERPGHRRHDDPSLRVVAESPSSESSYGARGPGPVTVSPARAVRIPAGPISAKRGRSLRIARAQSPAPGPPGPESSSEPQASTSRLPVAARLPLAGCQEPASLRLRLGRVHGRLDAGPATGLYNPPPGSRQALSGAAHPPAVAGAPVRLRPVTA
jgi:hypothetical protein